MLQEQRASGAFGQLRYTVSDLLDMYAKPPDGIAGWRQVTGARCHQSQCRSSHHRLRACILAHWTRWQALAHRHFPRRVCVRG